jgi:outer membrane protein TolC
MKHLLIKLIFQTCSLTGIGVGVIASFIGCVKVTAQQLSHSNVTYSFSNSPVETPEFEVKIPAVDVNQKSYLISPWISNISYSVSNSAEDSPSEFLTQGELISEETPEETPEEIMEDNPAQTPQENIEIRVDNNSTFNPVPVSMCMESLEEELKVTQLGDEVELGQILADLEDLYPSVNPLLFPTQPEEVIPQNIRGITLLQALELGRQNNRSLEIARLNLERSQYGLDEALAGKFPTVGVEAGFVRSDSSSRELSLKAAGLNDGDTISTNLTTGINLNYDLYTSGRLDAQIAIAQEQIKLNQLELERIEEETRLNIITDYYSLQSADAEVGIEQKALEDAARNLRDTELLESAGLGTKFDVLRAQVNLADANQRLTRAIAQRKIAKRRLTRRLNLGEEVEVFAFDKINVAKRWTCSLEESIIKAYRNRAELEQFLVQRTIEEQQTIVESSALKPQVSFFANYDILGVLDDDLPPADGFQLGVNVRWTLFDGGRVKARNQQNLTDQTIAETQFADQRNQVRFEVEDAYYNLEANNQNIETAAVAVTLATESLRLADLRLQAGVGTQTDVIGAQTELTRAYNNLLRAIIDYNLSLATLERSVSNLPEEKLY